MTVQGCQGPKSVVCSYDTATEAAASAQTEDANLLPEPMQALATSTDLGAQIAGLILLAGHEQRKSAKLSREAAEAAQKAAEERELKAMHEQATAKLAAGVVGGVMEIQSAAALGSGVDGNRLVAEVKSKVIDGFAKVDTALLNYVADGFGEDAKRAANGASHAKSAIDDARDQDKDARDTINKALDLYKEYLGAKADAQRAAFLKA